MLNNYFVWLTFREHHISNISHETANTNTQTRLTGTLTLKTPSSCDTANTVQWHGFGQHTLLLLCSLLYPQTFLTIKHQEVSWECIWLALLTIQWGYWTLWYRRSKLVFDIEIDLMKVGGIWVFAYYLSYGCQNLNCTYFCCLPQIIGVRVFTVSERMEFFNF
jgi:hypothetical protein